MCSPEYMELDQTGNVQPSKENHGSIELDVNKLSILKIRFLHNFIDQNSMKPAPSNGSHTSNLVGQIPPQEVKKEQTDLTEISPEELQQFEIKAAE